MSFADVFERDRKYFKHREDFAKRRSQVHYLADQINLAVFHKRPAKEINKLLDQLRELTKGATC